MDNFYQSLQLLVIGMSVTLVVLSGFGLCLLLSSRRIKSHAERVNTHQVDVDLNDEVVAVLAAAAARHAETPGVRQARAFPCARAGTGLGCQGRLNIMASPCNLKRNRSHEKLMITVNGKRYEVDVEVVQDDDQIEPQTVFRPPVRTG